MKLVNQILVVGNALAMSEALLFAQAGGLDLRKTLEAVVPGAAGSWMLANRGPQIINRDWRPGFTIDLQQKDVRLVLAAADQLGVPVVLSSLIFNLYRTLQNEGLGAEGNHALVKALERLAGLETMLSAGLEAVREVRPNFDAFYATLNDKQKTALDRLIDRRGRR